MNRARVLAPALIEALDLPDDVTLEEALASLPAEDRDELIALLDDEASLEAPEDFIARLIPSELAPKHVRPLLEFFERARHGQIFEAISMPPRHAKTVTILRCLAWWIVNHPRDLCAYVTYNSTQARKKSRIIRELVTRAGVPLQRGSTALEEWRTIYGGGLHAVGAKGGLTGNGYEGPVIYDDPYKSMIDATSALERDKIQELFQAAVMTRLHGASVMVLHTRWHVDDLIGWLVRDRGWTYTNIQAVAPANDNLLEAPDPLGRAPGEALWPELFPATRCAGPCHHYGHLDQIEEMIGPYLWAALFLGKPPRRGGAVFGEATLYDVDAVKLDGARPGIGVDPAATAAASADKSIVLAGQMTGRGTTAVLYVVDALRLQVEIPELVDALIPFSEAWPGAPLFVESNGVGKGVPQMLRKVDAIARKTEHDRRIAAWDADGRKGGQPPAPPPNLHIVPVRAVADKLLRAQAVAAAYRAGRVRWPARKAADGHLVPLPWVVQVLAVLRAFTGVSDAEDDDVDALAHLWNGLAGTAAGAGMSSVATVLAMLEHERDESDAA
ncbi:MAG: hypothetical protein KBD62_36430 [Kofleriaceae bacterium]|nr:hypothetical protein [Kofleriaceae bacterium]